MVEVLNNFVLPINVDRFAASQLRQRNQMTPAAEAHIYVFMAHAFPVKPVSHTHGVHKVRRGLFQHSGANPIDDVILIAAFKDYGIDSLQMQHLSQ